MKYLLRADNWYFERILNIDEKDIIHAVDDFKMLVSDAFDIGFNILSKYQLSARSKYFI